jgi:hypothetical protein
VQGTKLPELLLCVLVALLLTFAVPRPEAIPPDGWGVLGVFVATIIGTLTLSFVLYYDHIITPKARISLTKSCCSVAGFIGR